MSKNSTINLKNLFCFILILFVISIVFAQGVEEDFSFEMDNVSSKAAIGPGEYVDYAPTISNVGNISGYVCFKIRQPFIVEEDIPLYVFEISKPWILLKEYILEDGFISIFTYPEPLQPGQSTIPISKKIQMSPIPIPLYAKLDDINIAITMYASDSDDFSSIVF